MNQIPLPSKLATETIQLEFPFVVPVTADINSGAVAASVYSGTDALPSSIITGGASVSGDSLLQKVTGGTAGVIYQLIATATLSDGQILQLAGYLAIPPATL